MENLFPNILFFFFYIIAILLIYIKLYYWRNIKTSIASFIFFIINVSQLLLYCYSIFFLLFFKLEPIYIEKLPLVSKYKYLLFFIFFIIGVILFLFRIQFQKNSSVFVFPNVKEEIRLILKSWNDIFDEKCSEIMEYFISLNHYKKICFFLCHFIIFYSFRLIALGFFCCFTFFSGDLRYLLFLSPLLFIVWILSFLDYYFQVFFEYNCNYVRSLLSVKNNTNKIANKFNIIKACPTDFSYDLTFKAIDDGYLNKKVVIILWNQTANMYAYFIVYKRITYFFNLFILFFYFINWSFISFKVFLLTTNNFVAVNFFNIINIFKKGQGQIKRFYATDVRYPKRQYQKLLEHETQGVYKTGHPVLVDAAIRNPDNPTEIFYQGQATHGTGSSQHPSEPLNSTQDLQSNQRPQNFIPFTPVQYYPKNWSGQPIPGSETYCKQPETKGNINKNTPQEENT